MKTLKEGIIFYIFLITTLFLGWTKACRIPVIIDGEKLKFVRFGTSLKELAEREKIKITYNQAIWTEAGKLIIENRKTDFYIDGRKVELDFKFYKPSNLSYNKKMISFKNSKDLYILKEPDPQIIGKGPFLKFEKEGLPELITIYKNDSTKKIVRSGKPAVYIKTDGIKEKMVALTFDDGPSLYTAKILSVLKRNHVKATFFMIGLNVLKKPQIAKMVAAEGHLIGNHTLSHFSLKNRQLWFLEREITSSQKIIKDVCNVNPVWFRPPYMHYDSLTLSFIRTKGLKIALWTVDSEDWKAKKADAIYNNVISNLKPGSVILMHDGGGDRSETVKALERIIKEAYRRGYIFVTLADFSRLKSKSQ